MIGKIAIGIIVVLIVAIGLTQYYMAKRADRAHQTHPPTGQLLDIDGTQVHAHVEGEGPDLILLHGASGNTRDFTFSMVGQLSQTYRVIVFDRPGHGYTERLATRQDNGESLQEQAALLRKAAAKLRVEDAIVLGQSYGNAVALAYTLDFPEDVSALVNVAGVSQRWAGELDPWYRITNSLPGRMLLLPVIAAFIGQDRVMTSIDGIFAPNPVPQGYTDHIGADLSLRVVTLQANTQQVSRLKDDITALMPRYDELTLPVEILHGTDDITVPLDVHSRPLSEQVPTANLVVLDGIGHTPQHSAEAEVIEAIHRAAKRAGLR